jgi:phospholipase C
VPKVFISYSHDSQEHLDRVLALSDKLRADGIDALIDQYEPTPRDGWPLWMDLEIQKADFVILVCTEFYLRRVEHREDPGKGRGVLWEAKLIYTHLYLSDSLVQRFIPILFDDDEHANIPTPLRTMAFYQVDTKDGYEDLYRHLTQQPRHRMPECGQLRPLPPRDALSYPVSLGAIDRSPVTSQDRRNRRAMIKRIRQDWIEGVLKQSLYNVARIDLVLESEANHVEHGLRPVVQAPGQPPVAMAAGATIRSLFEDEGEALLILGAPGTGKTTLLLELASQLLDRAELDESYPVPVIFNLSSWAAHRRPFAQWLISELNERTEVPKKIARSWIDAEQVLPLLDGLDEVAVQHRQACAEEINRFRRDHGLLPIAVCSRIADYEALGVKLRMRNAVLVQPLSRTQVNDYLNRAGAALQPLRDAVKHDTNLAELLATPLMMWVAMLAYRDAPIESGEFVSVEQRTDRIFACFVDAMFQRTPGGQRYPKALILQWLSWLASALKRNERTVFYLEDLHLNWLPSRKQRGFLKSGIVVLWTGVLGIVVWLGVTGVLLGGGLGMVQWILLDSLTFLLLVSVTGGLLGTMTELRPSELIRFRLADVRRRAAKAIRSGLLGSMLLGVLFGLVVGLIMSSLGGDGLRVGLIFGTLSVPPFGLLSGLVTLVTTEAVEIRSRPNQGTRTSLRNGVIVIPTAGLLLGLLFGAMLGLLYGYTDDDLFEVLTPTSVAGAALGLFGGLTAGLIGGGLFAIKQATVRLTLWMTGSGPLDYPAFLNYATERLFLRRVGAGYMFLHRAVLEYFAAIGGKDVTEAVPGGPNPRKRRGLVWASIMTFTVAIAVFGLWVRYASSATAIHSRERAYEPTRKLLHEAANRNNPKTAEFVGVSQPDAIRQVEHLVVVLLEGSSFDHTLGGLKSIRPAIDGLTGNESNPDTNGEAVQVQPLAEFHGTLRPAPDSRFAATDRQIFDAATDPARAPTMRGFVKSYGSRPQQPLHSKKVMFYFDPDKVPVLATLALEFAVANRWFSSVPGPSWPNHLFADYGTAFGELGNNVLPLGPYNSIYERLIGSGRTAKIYQYDAVSVFVPLFVLTKQHPQLFGTLTQFLTDAHRGELPNFSLVEPNYSNRSDDELPSTRNGPPRLSADDYLVASVYNGIRRNDSLWRSTVLLITYANHGGFYDHVAPPAVSPDGYVASAKDTGTGSEFQFDRLGVRVPAIVVSPYIMRGTVDMTIYEHASIPATATSLFLGQYDKRSPREKTANTFLHVLTLATPRPGTDTVLFPIE